jgi:tetratricopeptide (TPR) repeat protein
VYHRQFKVRDADAAVGRALALLSTEPPGLPRERALALAARLQDSVAEWRGEWARAEELAEQGLARSERLGDQEAMSRWWKSLAFMAWYQGQPARAEERFRHGIQVAEEIGDQDRLMECWDGRGAAAADLHELDRAEDCLRRSLAIAERVGNPWGASATTWRLALLSRERGDLDAAVAGMRQAITLHEPLTDTLGALALHLLSLGWCLWQRGDLGEGEGCLRRALATWEDEVFPEGRARATLGLGGVLRDQGACVAARHWLRQARRAAPRHGLLALEVEATVEQGRTQLVAGRRRAAVAALARARRLVWGKEMADAAAHMLLLEVEVHLGEGRQAAAQTAAAEGLRLAGEGETQRVGRLWISTFSIRGRALQGLLQRLMGVCAVAQGDAAAAENHLRRALALQLEGGMALEAARTRLHLAEVLARASSGEGPAEARTLLAEAKAQFAASTAARDLAEAARLETLWSAR